MSNILTRSLTGAVYVAVIVCGVLLGTVPFMILGCLLAGLGVAEYTGLTEGSNPMRWPTRLLDVVGALIVVVGIDSLVECGGSFPAGRVALGLFLCYLIIRLLFELYSRSETPGSNIAFSLGGQLYVALPVALMAVVRSEWLGGSEWLLLAMFIMIWSSDTGAFLVGSAIGRHRLFESVSPKKSWEGFFGGLLMAMCAGAVMRYCFPAQFGQWSGLFMILMGALVAVFATWGDLVESLLKRSLHVKDSGRLLPGHGGILDRIDSLLMVAPAVAILLLLNFW